MMYIYWQGSEGPVKMQIRAQIVKGYVCNNSMLHIDFVPSIETKLNALKGWSWTCEVSKIDNLSQTLAFLKSLAAPAPDKKLPPSASQQSLF